MIETMLATALLAGGPSDISRLKPRIEPQCFQVVGKMLRAEDYNYNGQTVNRQFFSSKGSDKPDYALYYEYVGASRSQMRPFPTIKQVDLDGDMAPDKEYIDVLGNGQCKDVVEIPVGSGFTAKRMGK